MTHEEAMQDDFQVPNNVKLDSSHPEQGEQGELYRWVKASERLPEETGWFTVRQARFREVGCVHEMWFNIENKKWYWQSNPHSICGDGFIIEWLCKLSSPTSRRAE